MPDGALDLLEGGLGPPRWRRAWSALPRMGRAAVAAVLVLGVAVGGFVWLEERAAERELRQRVEIGVSLGLASSSTDLPGGSVWFYVAVRNDGPLAVTVTAVDGAAPGLRVAMRDAGDRVVAPGSQEDIPLSVRLTCAERSGPRPEVLAADVRVRPPDGGSTTERLELRPAARVTEFAATLCSVRPDIRDYELSVPGPRGG